MSEAEANAWASAHDSLHVYNNINDEDYNADETSLGGANYANHTAFDINNTTLEVIARAANGNLLNLATGLARNITVNVEIDGVTLPYIVNTDNYDDMPTAVQDAVNALSANGTNVFTGALAVIEAAIEAAVDEAYNDGYRDGFEDGYRQGYSDGFRDGVNSITS